MTGMRGFKRLTCIPVPVEDHHSQGAHQQRVRVGRQVGAGARVLPARSGVADGPAEARVPDVDGGHHGGLVQVARGEARVDAGIRPVRDDAGQASRPRVLLVHHILWAGGHLAPASRGRGLLRLRGVEGGGGAHVVHAVAVHVVEVDVADLRRGLVQQLHALRGQRLGQVGRGRRPVAGRVHGRLELAVHEARLDQVLPLVEGALGAAAADAHFGAGAAIAGSDASERRSRVRSILLTVHNSLR
mmetsp:Transcript_5013/g.6925  ORF Transcript_5013/g.6925 Transcript_5013/m.6925 type:complete len:244 (+) Transcript_5013:477-1208(+)